MIKNLPFTDNLAINTAFICLVVGEQKPKMPQILENKTWQTIVNPDESNRASRYKRPRPPIPMNLTERDEQIITHCFEDKILSTSDLQQIFFGAKARCVHRLRTLYSNHYLDRYFLPVSLPYWGATEAMYTIGRKGNSIF